MTLALTIVSHHGIWQSSDLRLYDANAGRRIPDATVKQFRVYFSDEHVALVTYAGVGRLDSEHVSDWLIDMLRGESRDLDRTLAALVGLANDRLVPAVKYMPPDYRRHVFVVGAFDARGPIVAEIANADVVKRDGYHVTTKLRQDFRVVCVRPSVGQGLASHVGAEFMEPRDIDLLVRLCATRPNRDADFLGLLAAMTRRASARHPALVSRECWSLHASPVRDRLHAPEEPTAFPAGAAMLSTSKPRTLINGIDYGLSMKPVMDAAAGHPERPLPPDVFARVVLEGLARAMSYAPGARIRHLVSGMTGRVNSDRGPGPWPQLIEVVWDSEPGRSIEVDRTEIVSAL